ncbi:methylated-DNA--[protein]-cysteine S-methyltransferase [Candidatus Uhrbacteria bacterium]|nr:methylated-DNA--[protein]-cysteine S-methyltransferase [Candidatus Uhrbacteria bacterium]
MVGLSQQVKIIQSDSGVESLTFSVDAEPDNSKVTQQIREYLAGYRQNFNVKLNPKGTPFQLNVWRALQTISFGQTATYQDIANKIGQPKAVRAVANAIGANPIAIIIPCHRVIRSDRSLGGYKWGVELKKRLLKLESLTC